MNEDKSRRELLEEPDPFLEFVEKTLTLAKTYQRQILAGLCSAVVLMLLIYAVVYFQNRTENQAAVKLGKAMDAYQALGPDADGAALEDAGKGFKEILDKYGRTGAGKAALVHYGDISFKLKKYDEAIATFGKALDAFDDPGFKSLMLSSLAYAYEGKGDIEKSISYFEMIVNAKSSVMMDQALFNLGRLYEKAGKAEKGKEAYSRLVKEFPDSMYFGLASEKTAG